MIPPCAHLGHVLVDVPLFAGPVVLLVVALLVVRRLGGLPGDPPEERR